MTLILIINLLVSIILCLVLRLFKVKEAWILFFSCVFMPGLGVLITLFYTIFRLFMSTNRRDFIKDKIKESENDLSKIQGDMNKKVDIIPIKDALALNKVDIKRSLMLHALKDDAYEYVRITKELLGDEDTEIAHYAASSLTDINTKLMGTVQKSEEEFHKNKEDISKAENYLKNISEYLKSGLVEGRDRKRLQYEYINTLEVMLNLEKIVESYLQQAINISIDLKEYIRAKRYSKIYLKNFPNAATPYILRAKIAYNEQDIDELKKTIKALSDTDILVTGDELKTLRYWIKE